MSATEGVAAGVHVGAASARAAVAAPRWMWFGIVGGAIVLIWALANARKAEPEPDWLDPNQPPISAPNDFSTVLLGQINTAPGAPLGGTRRPKKYPWTSLMDAPCCWVGDC